MKIYYNNNPENPNFYFMTWKENGLFSMYLKAPDMDTLELCPCVTGDDEKIFNEATQISEEFNHQFNSICKREHNYDGISRILQEVFNVDYKVIDRAYDRDLELADFVKDVMSEEEDGYRNDNWYFRKIYNKAKRYLNIWNGDKERAKKFIKKHDIPELYTIDCTLVDIFGECHPTVRMLNREFHNYWGDRFDKIVESAVEKYPDENDFDLAYYYTRDKLKEMDYGHE